MPSTKTRGKYNSRHGSPEINHGYVCLNLTSYRYMYIYLRISIIDLTCAGCCNCCCCCWLMPASVDWPRSWLCRAYILKYIPQSRERGPTMDCPPIPEFCLNFLQRSKTYLKERPPSASIANGDFPPSSKSKYVLRLVYTHYKVQIMLLHAAQCFTLV